MSRFSSIRARVTSIFVLTVACLAGGVTWLLVFGGERVADVEDFRMLHQVAREARDLLPHPDWQNRIGDLAATQTNRERGIAILVFDRDRVLWHTRGSVPDYRKPNDPTWRVAYARGRPNFVLVGRPTAGFLADRARIRTELILISVVVVIAVAGGSWLLVGRTLRPIREVARQAADASTDNLSVKLIAPSNDTEVVVLVDTLNGLLGRISDTVAAKGRFYSAASHELRTPLQALSGHLETALGQERSQEQYEAVIQEALRQTTRLTSLSQGLLLLHQLEAGTSRDVQDVDIGEVIRRVSDDLTPLLEARRLTLSIEIESTARVKSNPAHDEILIRNLLENAAKYATEAGAIQIRFFRNAVLEVFNECAPIPNWDSEKLFEPLYRLDSSRNAKTGGNGLGLAICRAVCQANGWTISLSQTSNGVRATVNLATR